MILLNNVTVSYPGHTVFKDLHLQLDSGVSYLVEGTNGTGKSTLLKLLAGVIFPQSGSVQYTFIDDSLDWDQKYALRKKYVHYIPSSALHDLVNTPDFFYQQRYYTIESTPLPTVRQYLGGRIQKLDTIQLPASFQLRQLLDLELTHLSNGQVKKLIILKQLLDAIPKVLLLDYPFEGLDAESRKGLRDFLDHLAVAHGIQLIIADHQHPEFPFAITKRCTVEQGGITIDNLIHHWDNPLTDSWSHGLPEKKNTEAVVEMQQVKIQYGDKVIIPSIDWKINRGERWALTGRNGSGKTTLFSLIYADHPMAYSEKVFLFGKRRGTGESIWDIKKRISYLGPEQLHFLDYLTGQLTVHEYLEATPSSQEQLSALVSYFQLSDLLSRKIYHLSHGQLQLILLVSLFLTQKELLLLDEPFQFLDPDTKQRVSNYLEAHLDESVTLVLITHYQSDVAKWTNHRLTL